MSMEQAMQDWNGCASYGLQGFSDLQKIIGPEIFTPALMKQMGANLSEAERLCAGDEILAQRVGMVRQMYTEAEAALAAIVGE